MYFIFVAPFLFVLPAISVLAEALLSHGSIDLMLLIGKWFVFWGVGVRLFIAGVRQVAQPQFTAESIFQAKIAVLWRLFARLASPTFRWGRWGYLHFRSRVSS